MIFSLSLPRTAASASRSASCWSMMSSCSCRRSSISKSMCFNHRSHFVRNAIKSIFEGQFTEICHLVPKHHAFVASPTHATGHASHFAAASLREEREWDLGLLPVLLLPMVVVLRLLVLLLLLLVAMEGLRGQTRGAVDLGDGAPLLARIVVVHVEVLLQVLGPRAPWARRHLLQELHYRQKQKTKTRGNMCTRTLYPLTKL